MVAVFACAYALFAVVLARVSKLPVTLFAALYAACARVVAVLACAKAEFACVKAVFALVLANVSIVPPPPPDCATNSNFCIDSLNAKTYPSVRLVMSTSSSLRKLTSPLPPLPPPIPLDMIVLT